MLPCFKCDKTLKNAVEESQNQPREGEVLYACAPDRCAAVEHAVALYRQLLRFRQSTCSPARFDSWLQPVRRRDLACYCALDQPCHADVLFEIAGGLS